MKLRLVVLVAAVGAGCSGTIDAPRPTVAAVATPKQQREDRMSPMGRLAAQHARALARKIGAQFFSFNDNCGVNPDCGDDSPFIDPDTTIPLASGQAETSIAVDRTGRHVVIGFNDFRGFTKNPISVSGVVYSDDGGKTFTDGGQLPSPGDGVVGTAKFPEVFGDATVKYLGGCTFIYGSILMKKLTSDPADTSTAQTMGVHRSTDCGHTWEGPFEVTAATNPAEAGDAADKEFLDVDPDTGRVMISWTNFGAAGPQIRTAYSDDAASGTPTWSPGVVVSATPVDGQGSMPAFARHSPNAYVAWARFPGGLTNGIAFSRSLDNGATWEAPIDLGAPFFPIDYILGNDRVHDFPSVAVDNSHGRHRGSIYVVHADNDNHDGSDIVLHRSTDGGQTFDAPIVLNSRPGSDRAQWFPSVSVDNTFGRVYVMYYDQGVARSGDLTQVSYTFSDDGGTSWTRPRALTDRPFHAGWGNDTSQPNLGDYIQGAARDGDLYSAYAVTHPVGFTDGEPASASMTVPDVESKHTDLGARFGASATVQAGAPTFRDSGNDGNIDPGEFVTVQIPITNFVTNPLNATTLHDLTAWADTTAAGVIVLPPFQLISSLAPGASDSFTVTLLVGSDFVAGTPIDIALHVFQGAPFGLATLHATVDTGTHTTTTLLSESFDGALGANGLPAGWAAVHAGGKNVVPWKTSSGFCGSKSNGAFHVEAEDGPASTTGAIDSTRWERLLSPMINVPADGGDVTLEFDVCFDTEDDPSFNVLAYDGFFLRIFDNTAGHLPRSVLAEAFQSKFTTGDEEGYPKHFPRSQNTAYFQDMSAWAGDSSGIKHVKLRLPGMAGTTVQLRFEYTQDANGLCSDVRPGHDCGVFIDNVVMKSEKLAPPAIP